MTGLKPLNLITAERVSVLDHGYVEVIDSWGSDESIIEAARMSTDKGFLGWEPGVCQVCAGFPAGFCAACGGTGTHKGDARLLRYLWTNKHSTPFEFAGLTIEVQAPIFVFREWHRHRTQSYAERSARYTPLPDFNYVPTVERCLAGGGHLTKQAASVGTASLDAEAAQRWLDTLELFYTTAETHYQGGLSMGVPKELARLCLPVGRYTAMRASTDLRNWLGFCALRLPSTAQYEIRVYAEAVHRALSLRFPRTLALFDEGAGRSPLPSSAVT